MTGAITRPTHGFRVWAARALAALIVALGLIALVGFAFAPLIIRHSIIDYFDKTLHRKASLDRVKVNPFALSLELDGFSAPDRDGQPVMAFSRLFFRIDLATVLRGELSLADVDLKSPKVRIVRRPNGQVNLADFLPPPPKTPKEPSKPVTLRIENFRLTGGGVVLVDEARKEPLQRRLDPINFTLKDFSTTAGGGTLSLNAHSDLGEELRWSGVVSLNPIQSSGRIALSNVRLDGLKKAVLINLPVDTHGGVINLAGDYGFSLSGGTPNLNLHLSDLSLSEVALAPQGETADMIRIGKIEASPLALDLRQRAVAVGKLTVTGAFVDAALEKSGLNLARLAPKADPAAAAPAPGGAGGGRSDPAADARPWTIAAPDIVLAAGKMRFADRTLKRPFEIDVDDAEATLKNVAFPFQQPLRIDASATLGDGAKVSAAGDVVLPTKAGTAVTADLQTMVDSLDLAEFQPYVAESARIRIKGGDLSAKGRVILGANGGVSYAGGAEIDDLKTEDPDLKQDLVTWDALSAQGVKATTKPLALEIKKVSADKAYARVVLESNYVVNVRAVLDANGPPQNRDLGAASLDLAQRDLAKPNPPKANLPPAPKAAKSSAGGGVGFPLKIDQVAVNYGQMDFTDLTVLPHFSAGISKLNGTVQGISSAPDSKADINLNGEVGPFAPVAIKGKVNYLAPIAYTDVGMAFHNMELTTFSPYSGKFAGYRIDKGKLSIDLHYLIDHQKLDATHHVVIDQLQLGDKVDSQDAVKLPVKLIVALLKDKNGVIDLPIDVSGSLDDPKFQIWPVIWKVVGTLLDKIAAAPFTLLGHLMGGAGGEEMGVIEFQPGSSEVAPSELKKIESLSKALAERPALSVEIPMTSNDALDRPALALAKFDAALQEAALRSAPKGTTPEAARGLLNASRGRRKALEFLYRQETGTKPALPHPKPGKPGEKPDPDASAASWLEEALRPRFAASDVSVRQLAEARAQAVETALVKGSGLDPKRLFIITAPAETDAKVEMKLQLK